MMTNESNTNNKNNNKRLIQDASDALLFLNDTYTNKNANMHDMEFLKYVEDIAQDIVYNLTQTLRNLTEELDED